MTPARHAGFFLFVLLGLIPFLVDAQPVSKPDGEWRAQINVGFTYAKGNTNATTGIAKADAVRQTVDDKWTLYGEFLRARTEGVTSGNRDHLGGRYDWNLTPRVFSLATAEGERDTIAGLKRRLLGNVGLGYKFVDRDDLHFNVLSGIGYATDRYTVPRDVHGEMVLRFERPTVMVGEESAHKFSETTSANQRLTLTRDVDSAGEYRAQWDANLAVAMTSRIALTVGLNTRYDSAPGIGLKRTDTLLTTGIAMKIE